MGCDVVGGYGKEFIFEDDDDEEKSLLEFNDL